MSRFHISQDDTGYYQLTYESDEGELTLVSHQFPRADHLIDDARQLVATGDYGDALIVIAPPRRDVSASGAPYTKPAPRKAGA